VWLLLIMMPFVYMQKAFQFFTFFDVLVILFGFSFRHPQNVKN